MPCFAPHFASLWQLVRDIAAARRLLRERQGKGVPSTTADTV